MGYRATLHTDDEFNGLVRVGGTPREAVVKLAQTLTGYTGAYHRANASGGCIYAEFMPNIRHAVTLEEI